VVADFRAFTHRLGYAFAVAPHDRPFLGPLYAWIAVHNDSTCLALPAMIKLILKWLAARLRLRRVTKAVVRPRAIQEAFRADAKAEGDKIVLGGWSTLQGTDTWAAPWFMVELTKANAPWAYAKGEPFRVIAALELLASLLGLMFLIPDVDHGLRESGIRFTATTDNQGNAKLLHKYMTSKFPLAPILMEVAVQSERKGLRLHVEWAPRAQNEEADALTNGDLGGFNPELRVPIDFAKIEFVVLKDMIEAGLALFQGGRCM
jgi:hypothetical protein